MDEGEGGGCTTLRMVADGRWVDNGRLHHDSARRNSNSFTPPECSGVLPSVCLLSAGQLACCWLPCRYNNQITVHARLLATAPDKDSKQGVQKPHPFWQRTNDNSKNLPVIAG